MSYLIKIKRLSYILKFFELGKEPKNIKEIQNYLKKHYNLPFSQRTLKRDIASLREDYGIEIHYNTDKQKYTLGDENKSEIEGFSRFMEIAKISEIINDDRKEDIPKYILFDNGSGLKGVDMFETLFKAIKNRNIISFKYFNFQTEQTKDYVIQPYLLKEYQKRWYLVGIINRTTELKTFGIDRIENLFVTDIIFTRNLAIDVRKRFKDIIGISLANDAKIEKVTLSYKPDQFHYVKALPLHNSQVVIENKSMIELHVVPNYELMQNILMHQAQIKVIEPKWLADKIKDFHKAAFEQYS